MSLLNKWCVDENKTIILTHHHSKASGTNKSSARGASAFIDACRMHYVIEKVEVKTFEPQKETPKKYSMPTLGDLDETEVDELWLESKP